MCKQVSKWAMCKQASYPLLVSILILFAFSIHLQVSWIRKRDLHILTAGSTTYTSDQRFQVSSSGGMTYMTYCAANLPSRDLLQVLRPDNSANWTLQIKYPQPRDSGVYECQINTEPKMSLSYTFNVVGECQPTRQTTDPLDRVSCSYRLNLDTLALLLCINW